MGHTELLLRSIRYDNHDAGVTGSTQGANAPPYPFDLTLLQDFDELVLAKPVSFFVGDNGCGKSTLLNGIAGNAGLPTIGAQSSRQSAAQLADRLTLVKSKPIRHGCYFRADQVALFLQGLVQSMADHASMVNEFAEIEGDWGRDRAQGLARNERQALSERYGEDPAAKSHGELYLNLLQQRINAPGLYLLDEPETPLSPTNQLALIALLVDAVERTASQFIIATHSPILLALPDAQIFDCNGRRPEPIEWAQTEHVSVTRAFLNNPQQYLKHFVGQLGDAD